MTYESKTTDYWFKCPGCNLLAAIDEEQADGTVSILCPNCGFHRTGKVEPKIPTYVPMHLRDAPTMREDQL